MSNKFFISTDKSKLDLSVITNFLTNNSYWAKDRSIKTIEKSIKNSLCFGVYAQGYVQVGFARVATDYSVFAWIMDLFILEEYRKKGLSKLLMGEILAHPELQGLQRWGLATEDAHGLYEKYGFRVLSKPEMMMELTYRPS